VSYSQKAMHLLHAKQYQGAIALFDLALRLAPRDANLYWNRGCACARLGDRQGTLWSVWQAIQISPHMKKNAKRDKDLAQFQNDPEFVRMVAE
jgi:Flp pilus assembly protein TadD